MARLVINILRAAGLPHAALVVSIGCGGLPPGGASGTDDGGSSTTTEGSSAAASSGGSAPSNSDGTTSGLDCTASESGSTGSADSTASTDSTNSTDSTDSSGTDTGARVDFEVLVNSRGTNAIFRYDMDGNFMGEFIASGAGGLASPEDVLFHPDGRVLVSGFGNATIKEYDVSGAYLGDFSSGYALANPSKMSIGPDDLIYITQWDAVQNEIVRFDLDGQFVDEFTTVGAPNGLGHFWDAEGRFYVALFGSANDGTVHRFDPMGADLGTFIDSAVLQGPTDIWQEASGEILVEDWIAGTVLRYSESGEYIETFLSGMTSPEGIAFTPSGDLLIGDWGEDAVHRFDASGNDLGYFASGDGLTDPNHVVVVTDLE